LDNPNKAITTNFTPVSQIPVDNHLTGLFTSFTE